MRSITLEEYENRIRIYGSQYEACRRGIHHIGYPKAAICPFCGIEVEWIKQKIEQLKADGPDD